MCSTCNQNNCGCEQNICNQCQSQEPCECPVVDLSTNCVLYDGENIICGDTIVVPKNTILSNALQLIVSYFCGAIEEVKKYLRLINVGIGAEIYAGDTLLGEKKLRKINSSSDIITVTQNTNDISIGVDEDALNDFVEGSQKTYSMVNVGGGLPTYKDSTIVGDNIQFNLKTLLVDSQTGTGEPIVRDFQNNVNDNTLRLKKINSTSLLVTATDEEITIETPSETGVPEFIVNSDYTGLIEEGSVSKPFKSLQNAINQYIGTGDNKNPEYIGYIIRVKKDINIFTGSLACKSLNLLIETGATLTSNPTYGEYLLDYDSDATLPPTYTVFSDTDIDSITITVSQGAVLALSKQGFKNRGTTFNDNLSKGKLIQLQGDGTIVINQENSIVSPSIRKIISVNEGNSIGYFNGGNVAHFGINCNLMSYNSQIIYAGLNSKIRAEFGNSPIIKFSDNQTAQSNIDTKPIEIEGGDVILKNIQLECYGYLDANEINRFISINNNSAILIIENCRFIGSVLSLFENIGSTQPTLRIVNSNFSIAIDDKTFKSASVIWTNIRTEFSNYSIVTPLDDVILMPNTLNGFGGYLVETLSEYPSKLAAQTALLPIGSAFINRKVITAGSFVPGVEYKISSIGTTDFTLIGASANTIGLYFTATGGGTGTGTADLIIRDILI